MGLTNAKWGALVLLVGAAVACGDEVADPPTLGSDGSTSGMSGDEASTWVVSATDAEPTTGGPTEVPSSTGGESSGSTTVAVSTGSTGTASTGEQIGPPAPEDDTYVIALSETPLSINPASGLLSNDAHPEQLTVTAFDAVSAAGIDVDVGDNGAFTYSPDGPYWGVPDGFTYTVSNELGEEASANVEILIVADTVPLPVVADGAGGFVMEGEELSLTGASVAIAGDVNDDGLDDMIVGAPGGEGRAFVVFGKDDGAAIDLAAIAAGGGGGFAILGDPAGGLVGNAVAAAGDVNDDGMADLILGAASASSDAGRTYVVFGKAGTAAVDLAALGSGGFTIDGELAGDDSGNAVAGVGDMNGDDYADVAVAASGASPNGDGSGRVYVVFGKADAAAVALADVADGSGGFRIDGAAEGVSVGRSIAGVGDVDGDLVPDVLVGAPGGSTGGAAHLVLGKASGTPVLLDGSGDGVFDITAELAGDQAGYAVGPAGDMDGDGLADLVVTALFSDAGGIDSGRAYVVFGKDDTDTVALADVATGSGGFAVTPEFWDKLGYSCAGGGDVDGDGVPDVIAGAISNFDSAGRSFVVYGKDDTTAVDATDLTGGAGGFVIDAEMEGDLAGISVGGGGDINGDGLADVVVGALGYPDFGLRGRAYVIFGGRSAL